MLHYQDLINEVTALCTRMYTYSMQIGSFWVDLYICIVNVKARVS